MQLVMRQPSAFAKSIMLNNEPNAVEKYVGFLKSGGSDYQ